VWLILVNDDDDESMSSDESLSIEFPPPPSEFSTSTVINNTCQFIPVKNPFVQTTIIRSDAGKNLKKLSSTQFYSFQFYIIVSIIIINLVGFFCMFCGDSVCFLFYPLTPVKKKLTV
jgi:hypothetical protein